MEKGRRRKIANLGGLRNLWGGLKDSALNLNSTGRRLGTEKRGGGEGRPRSIGERESRSGGGGQLGRSMPRLQEKRPGHKDEMLRERK